MPVELVPFFGDSASHWKHGNKNVENNNNIKIQMKANGSQCPRSSGTQWRCYREEGSSDAAK